MSRVIMRGYRIELLKRLDAAYIDHDKAMIQTGNHDEQLVIGARLETLQEMAELLGVKAIERWRCALASCGAWLPRGTNDRYCDGACRQKAYRIRKGQRKL